MRIRVVARLIVLCSLILGLPAELIAQGGHPARRTAEHRVSVVVPVIVTLLPPEPGSADQAWRVRTNDPNLRKRLQLGIPAARRGGDTLQVTIATP